MQQTSSHDVDVGPSNRVQQSSSSSPAWVMPSLLGGSKQQVLLGLAAAAGVGVFGSGFELDGPGSVLEALAVLASIIAVHEWGHFTAARLQGIHVTQFAIGFGPPLISFKVGESAVSSKHGHRHRLFASALQMHTSVLHAELVALAVLGSSAPAAVHQRPGTLWPCTSWPAYCALQSVALQALCAHHFHCCCLISQKCNCTVT